MSAHFHLHFNTFHHTCCPLFCLSWHCFPLLALPVSTVFWNVSEFALFTAANSEFFFFLQFYIAQTQPISIVSIYIKQGHIRSSVCAPHVLPNFIMKLTFHSSRLQGFTISKPLLSGRRGVEIQKDFGGWKLLPSNDIYVNVIVLPCAGESSVMQPRPGEERWH